MLLSPQELFDLTGRKYAKHQRAWLVENGYVFDVAADGKPKVSRGYVEARLGGGRKPPINSGPDYSYIKAGVQK